MYYIYGLAALVHIIQAGLTRVDAIHTINIKYILLNCPRSISRLY